MAGTESSMATDASGKGGKKKGAAAGRSGPKTQSEEQLMEIIEELRNDLRIRDEEFSEQSAYVEKLQS